MFHKLSARAAGYPLSDMPVPLQRAIVTAIETAWRDVLAHSSRFIDEKDATTVLVEALRDVRASGRVPAFTDRFFQTPSRDACETNFNGQALDKRPDIHLRLIDAIDDFHGWFVECKVVDARHPVRLYVRQGIDRYVLGDYAWAMPSALMIAYAGVGFTTATHLAPALPAGIAPFPAGLATGADSCRTKH
ncbi:MAG: hypothetical protein ACOYOB_19245, partial [Myxococcota bacterium]